ncbi:MAG: DUF5691 domain-containing protein [Caldilineaceae bacterium]
MTIMEELGRSALLGAQRGELPALPTNDSPLGQYLATLNRDQPEALLLNAAGALSIYEQIGRMPRRLISAETGALDQSDTPAVTVSSPNATAALFIMLNGSYAELLTEFLSALAAAGQTAPHLHLPNLLDHGARNPSTRRLILPVLDATGRWLAGQNPEWRWAAPGVEKWEAMLELWKTDKPQARQALLRQQRLVDPAAGLRLLQSTWKAEDATRRAGLIGALETGLSMTDEPFLETALDDRLSAVRKKAAELLARLPASRLCRRMVQNTAELFHWEPETDEKVRLQFPDEFAPAIFRDGVVKRPGQDLARIRSNQLIEIMGAIPLDHWTTTWNATPNAIIEARTASKWPVSLLRGFAVAAERQQRIDWAKLLLRADNFGLNTLRLVAILPLADFTALAHELDAQLPTDEIITKETVLVKVLRKWEGPWTLPLIQLWLPRLRAYIAQDMESKTPDVILRATLRQMARQAAPAHIAIVIDELRPMIQENIWRPAILEALSLLTFRRRMLEGVGEVETAE